MALILWCSAIPGLQCLVLRKYYRDVISNHMEGENSFRVILKDFVETGVVKITENQVKWPKTNSLITLAQCRSEEDFQKAQGIGKHVLVWDEATQIKQRYINDIRGWVRMSQEMKAVLPEQFKDVFPRIIYTCNPIGESVSWFRRNFITCRKPFEIEKVGAFTRQFIPSLITDNPSADPVAQRERLSTMHSAAVAEALITGNWDTPTGDFFPEYNDEVHSIPDFTPPNWWFKFRTFDWGSNDPFAVYWWAVSDGEGFIDDHGQNRWYPRGALIAYREWYGCQEQDPAKGLHLRNADIAAGIVSRTKETTSGLTFSDNFPFADRGYSKGKERFTMADDFRENGCPLTLGNTARIYGWKQFRSRLQGTGGVPLIYFMKSCVYARDYVPALPHHDTRSEDAAEDGESTHSCDAIRLACTLKPLVKDEPVKKEINYESPKRRATPEMIVSYLNSQGQKRKYVTKK